MKKLIPILGLLFAGLFYLGCSEDYPTQSSDDQGIVVFEDGGLIASKGKPGGGGGPGGDPDPTYTVTVDVGEFGSGEVFDSPGAGRSIGEADLTFTFDAAPDCSSATEEFPVTVTGIFTIMARQNRKHPEDGFTYAQAEFWNFDIDGIQGLVFDIDNDALFAEYAVGNWPPKTDPVTLTGGTNGDGGDMLLWSRNKNHACYNYPIPEHWTITVTRN